MPELPEVITTSRYLNKKIVGQTIRNFWFDTPKLIKYLEKSSEKASVKKQELFKKDIVGKKILKVTNKGKNVLIYLSDNHLLLVHQKMTGHLLLGKWNIKKVSKGRFEVKSALPGVLDEPVNQYIRVIFGLSGRTDLGLSDLRKFAKVILGKRKDLEKLSDLKDLGPTPMETDYKTFKSLIKKTTRPIKQALMDQNLIAGIGNIYSDDILWDAKINPFKSASSISDKDFKRIFESSKKILNEAISYKGTSISDYRTPSGESGYYTDRRRVYQREDEPCKRCGSKIIRKKIGGRSAHYCPGCQK